MAGGKEGGEAVTANLNGFKVKWEGVVGLVIVTII